jgi:hypothetical protein
MNVASREKPQMDVPKRVLFATDPGDERATGRIVALSVTGAELSSLEAPPVGSNLFLWAELIEGDGVVEMYGRVQWATETRFAVQFGPLGERETNAIVRASSRPPPPT